MSENEKKGEQRRYVVLHRESEHDRWIQTEEFVLAGGAGEAVRKLVKEQGDGADIDGYYVAVPARSFKPILVEKKVATQIKFG